MSPKRLAEVVTEAPPSTAEQRARAAARRVEEKIAAAVAEAPPLPEDLAARLVDLVRSTHAPTPLRSADRQHVGARPRRAAA